jgi:hypothetical protein
MLAGLLDCLKYYLYIFLDGLKKLAKQLAAIGQRFEFTISRKRSKNVHYTTAMLGFVRAVDPKLAVDRMSLTTQRGNSWGPYPMDCPAWFPPQQWELPVTFPRDLASGQCKNGPTYLPFYWEGERDCKPHSMSAFNVFIFTTVVYYLIATTVGKST